MQVLEDWDFAKADIHYMTHGLHLYPARMIPQIARRLIELYGQKASKVLDPFCGSGGVLVESFLAGKNSVGIDLNPLACLIARVKATPLDPSSLTHAWSRVREHIDLATTKRFERSQVETPEFPDVNIHYWFKPRTIEDLAIIREAIGTIDNIQIQDFFKVCFSSTIRQVSGTRKGEFKLYRVSSEEWAKWNPDTFRIFEDKVNNAISKMGEFYQATRHHANVTAKVFETDTRMILTDEFPKNAAKELTEESVDLVVTSPPYGDSHTTVAYGQFSKYSLIWLGYNKKQALEVDKASIGGRRNGVSFSSDELDKAASKIRNQKRAKEVEDFFVDLAKCVERLNEVMRPGGRACFVLGNRTVNGIAIPTDRVLSEIGGEFGFDTINTIQRNIPSKRIPWKSSPTNVPGQKVGTIAKESIVVLRKS